MNLSLISLISTYTIILICNRKFRGVILDAFFFVMTPYVGLIFINNVFMVKNGFTAISDRTIQIHLWSMIVFYLGSVIGQNVGKKFRLKPLTKKIGIEDISMKKLSQLGFFCAIFVTVGKQLLIRQYGFIGFLSKGDLIGMSSIFNHVELFLYPIAMLMFEQYLENKNKWLLFLTGYSYVLIFSSFVKYHVISLFISTFIYIAIRHRKYVIKIGIATGIIIVFAFVSNYIINFATNNVSVNSKFYGTHLWMYISGGTINVESGLRYAQSAFPNMSIAAWIWQMITSFPSIFTNKLLGFHISDYAFSTVLPSFSIGIASSNVISIIGSAYIQGNVLSFSLFSFFWGWIVQLIYRKIRFGESISLGATLAGSVFLAYNMLSFFSSFFVLSNPWETMLLCLILPRIIRTSKDRVKEYQRVPKGNGDHIIICILQYVFQRTIEAT